MGLNYRDSPPIEFNTLGFLRFSSVSIVQALQVDVKQKANEPLRNLETGTVCLTWA